MERTASLLSFSSRSSSHDSTNRNNDPLLPYAENVFDKKALRGHSIFRRCLYRRVLIWTVVSMILVSFALFTAGDGMVSSTGSGVGQPPAAKPPLAQPTIIGNEDGGPVLVIVDKDKEMQKEKNGQKTDKAAEEKTEPSGENKVEGDGNKDEKKEEGKEEKATEQGKEDQKIQAPLETEDELSAEEDAAALKKWDEDLKKMPWLRFIPLNGYFNGLKSLVAKADHIPEYPNPNVEVPLGEPPLSQDVPKPKLYDPYNSSDSSVKTCYLDKDDKIPAPSLYAYDGVPQHMPDPSIGSHSIFGIRDDVCFDRFGRYGPYGFGYKLVDGGSDIDWGDVQERCATANKHRFAEPDPDTESLNFDDGKKGRIAVVIRLYTGFQWTQLAVLNFRAMITELSLRSGGEYNVHFLLHVKDNDTPIWSDDVTVQMLLDSNVPPEFHGLVTLWSEAQMELFYPGKFEDPISKPPINNPAARGVHGVFRSAHLPLQVFALQHPEYEHFWNWELDMRYLGNWYELFDRLGHWADQQPRKLLWERNERYYVPAHHGTWENFTAAVEQYTKDSGKPGVFGPVEFPERGQLRYEQRGGSAMPASCLANPEDPECGVAPPRRCAIITASRLSRRLLMAMHEQVWRNHHTMFSEMFPASVAFHHGFKAVYAPHPVFLDRAWEPQGSAVDKVFNGGRDHSTSAVGSPFDLRNEHNFKGATWYFNSEFAGLLWRRWLGFAQLDARGKTGHRKGGGKIRGGKAEEESEASSGRMCLRSFLVHPIKFESPDDKK
ncbi:hypothetical protein TgHK011_006153 [Trichoderma gracile]|nr:hypothetical protein TgHK011_006153 [Trichoderma gracile]